MKNNKLPILFVVAVILLIVGVMSKHRSKKSIVEVVNLKTLLSDSWSTDKVAKIEIQVPKSEKPAANKDKDSLDLSASAVTHQSLKLMKQTDGKWILPELFNAEVKQGKIESLMKMLKESEGEFRSDSKEVLKDYSLDDKKAMRISLYKQGEAKPGWELFIGKNADNSTHFVRLHNENKVYVINKNLRNEVGASSSELDKGPDYKKFLNLKMLATKEPEIKEVIFKTAFAEYRLEKVTEEREVKAPATKDKKETKQEAPKMEKVDVWKVAAGNVGFSLKKDGVNQLVNKLNGLTAKDVVGSAAEAGDSKYGFNEKSLKITLVAKNGSKKEFMVGGKVMDGAKEKNEYYVRNGEKSNIFTLASSNVNNIFVNQKDLFDLNVLKLDKSQLVKITLKGKDSFTLKKNTKEDKWEMVGLEAKKKLKESKINDLIKAFSKISAHGLANRIVSINKTKYQAEIKSSDGNQYNILVGEEELPGTTFLAKLSGVKQNVLLEESVVNKLFPAKSDLVE